MEIVSIFTVTDFKTGKQYEEAITGSGQDTVESVVSMYPAFTKFVLEGFEINGNFFPLDLRYTPRYLRNRSKRRK